MIIGAHRPRALSQRCHGEGDFLFLGGICGSYARSKLKWRISLRLSLRLRCVSVRVHTHTHTELNRMLHFFFACYYSSELHDTLFAFIYNAHFSFQLNLVSLIIDLIFDETFSHYNLFSKAME